MACAVPEVDGKQLTCAIYIEQFKEPKVLPCLHTYCKGCLVKLVKKQGLDHFITCPECQQDTKERWSSQNLSFSRSMTNVTVCLDELTCFTLEQTRKKVSCSRWLANW